MRCSSCGENFVMANLTFMPSGEYLCPRELHAIAMEQMAHKVAQEPHPYTRSPRPVTILDPGRKRRRPK